MPYTVLDPSTAAAAPDTGDLGKPLLEVGDTFEGMQQALMDELFRRSSLVNDMTPVRRWINQAYRNLCASLDINELWGSVNFALVTDQPFYLAPDILSWVKRWMLVDTADFIFDGGRELKMIDLQTYRNLADTDSLLSTGGSTDWLIPESYFRFARMMVIWPTPQADFTAPMDFRIRPLDMEGPTDSPILPTEFHEAIFHLARVRAFRALKMYKESALAQNDFLVTLRPLLNSDAEEKDAMNMVMQPVTRASQLYRSSPREDD